MMLCGKVVGGLFLINGMVFVCGYVCDFDYWCDSGVEGWGYVDVLFYFWCMEMLYSVVSDYCGSEGLLYVMCGLCKNLLFDVFIWVGW